MHEKRDLIQIESGVQISYSTMQGVRDQRKLESIWVQNYMNHITGKTQSNSIKQEPKGTQISHYTIFSSIPKNMFLGKEAEENYYQQIHAKQMVASF